MSIGDGGGQTRIIAEIDGERAHQTGEICRIAVRAGRVNLFNPADGIASAETPENDK